MAKARSTSPGDVVLIHLRDQPASFARVEAIRPHPRPGWFFCDLLVLAVPPQPVTWILQPHQIDGTPFTMGGEPVRVDRLPEIGAIHRGATAGEGEAEREPERAPSRERPARGARSSRGGKVVSLFPRGVDEADES